MAKMHIALCYRSGEIDVVSAGLALPPGVIVFAQGPRAELEAIISTRARHSYHAELYLVPGVPEADDDDAAIAALMAWVGWAFGDAPELLSKVRLPKPNMEAK